MVMVADSIPGSQEMDRRPWSERQCQTTGDPHGRRVPAARREDVLLARGGAVRCETRHRAQISRFLARPRWRKLDINSILAEDSCCELEVKDGEFVYIIDATLTSQAGKQHRKHLQHRQPQTAAVQRASLWQEQDTPGRMCHSFTIGLLITPSGIRIPFCKPYHTREYCEKKKSRPETSHHGRGGSRSDSRTAAAGRGDSDCAGRYGVRRRSQSATLAGTAATRGFSRATPSVSWLARKGSGRRCVRS